MPQRDRQAWETGKPILARLPYKNYQDNPVVAWVTSAFDEKLTEVYTKLVNFYKELDPDLASPNSLDYLGWLVGLGDYYWDTTWSAQVKRDFIRQSQGLLRLRGTRDSFDKVMAIHNLDYSVWSSSALFLSFRVPVTLGSSEPRLFIRLPLRYQRRQAQFLEAERTRLNWLPAVTKSRTVYDYFYAGFSVVGDPVFSVPLWEPPGAGSATLRLVPGETKTGNLTSISSYDGFPASVPRRFWAETRTQSGTLAILANGSWTYQAGSGFYTDSFTWSVFNDRLGAEGTLNLVVSPIVFRDDFSNLGRPDGTQITVPPAGSASNPRGFSYSGSGTAWTYLGDQVQTGAGAAALTLNSDQPNVILRLTRISSNHTFTLRYAGLNGSNYLETTYNPVTGLINTYQVLAGVGINQTLSTAPTSIVSAGLPVTLEVKFYQGQISIAVNSVTVQRLVGMDFFPGSNTISLVSLAAQTFNSLELEANYSAGYTLVGSDDFSGTGAPLVTTNGISYIGSGTMTKANGSVSASSAYAGLYLALGSLNQRVVGTFFRTTLLGTDQSMRIILREDLAANSRLYVVAENGLINLVRQVGAAFVSIAASSVTTFDLNRRYRLEGIISGTRIQVLLDGVTVIQFTDASAPTGTRAGIQFGNSFGNQFWDSWLAESF